MSKLTDYLDTVAAQAERAAYYEEADVELLEHVCRLVALCREQAELLDKVGAAWRASSQVLELMKAALDAERSWLIDTARELREWRELQEREVT